MNAIIQNIKDFFTGMSEWGINLPKIVLVPLVMILAIAGTVLIVKALQWLIGFIFRDKGKKFIKGFAQYTRNVDDRTRDLASGGMNNSQQNQG